MARILAVMFIGLGALTLFGNFPSPKAAKTDADLIQGVWNWDPDAKQSEAKPQILLEHVVIKDNKLTFHYNFDGKKFTSTTEFKLDPTQTPKQIDITATEGNNKVRTTLGLYEIQDGRLKICYRSSGAGRPKDFDDKQARNSDNNTNEVTSFVVLKK
jgi:uncharacterized protein (TIGR03067 family)